MSNALSRKLVVVLGMHRSGTSALSRALLTLGMELGDDLIPGIENNNEKGFFEDAEISAFNEFELLRALGLTWSSLALVDRVEFERPEVRALESRAAGILDRKLLAAPVLGLKDPRLCRLLPFWHRVFAQLELHPFYLIALRNPLSVARSLARRDGFGTTRSCLLWLAHVVAAVEETQGVPRLFVNYDLLIDDPVGQLQRIARASDIRFEDIPPSVLHDYVDGFLSTGFRHSMFDLAAMEGDKHVPAIVGNLLRLLNPLTSDELASESAVFMEGWSGIKRQVGELSPLLDLLRELDTAQLVLSRSLTQKDGEIASYKSTLVAREGQIDALNRLLAIREAHIETQRQGIEAQKRSIDSQQQQIDSQQQQIDSQQQQIDSKQREIDSRQQKIDSQMQQLEREISLLHERDGQIAALINSTSWKMTRPLRFAARMVRKLIAR